MRLYVGICASALLVSGPATALSCEDFLDKVATSRYAKLLPEFDLQESSNLPGLFNITNLKNISAAYTCVGGEFEGLGATLGKGGEADRTRWAALVGAVLEAIKPSRSSLKGMDFVNRLQTEAIEAAELEEVKTGIRAGSAEGSYGDFSVGLTVFPGQIQIQIKR